MPFWDDSIFDDQIISLWGESDSEAYDFGI
jgi:hypothetical protein